MDVEDSRKEINKIRDYRQKKERNKEEENRDELFAAVRSGISLFACAVVVVVVDLPH